MMFVVLLFSESEFKAAAEVSAFPFSHCLLIQWLSQMLNCGYQWRQNGWLTAVGLHRATLRKLALISCLILFKESKSLLKKIKWIVAVVPWSSIIWPKLWGINFKIYFKQSSENTLWEYLSFKTLRYVQVSKHNTPVFCDPTESSKEKTLGKEKRVSLR